MLVHKNDGSRDFECIQTIDFSEHDLTSLIDDDWSRACINPKAVIYKEIVYQCPSSHELKEYPKKFAWLTENLKQKDDVKLYAGVDDPFPMIHVENADDMSLMMAVGDQYTSKADKGLKNSFFLFLP